MGVRQARHLFHSWSAAVFFIASTAVTSSNAARVSLLNCRVATTGLLALLCTTYPDFHIVFIALIALDIFSHWFQMYQTLLAGSTTHKVWLARGVWVLVVGGQHRGGGGGCGQMASKRATAAAVEAALVDRTVGGAGQESHDVCSCMRAGSNNQSVAPSTPCTYLHTRNTQEVNSRSRLVRLYYSNRIFMGFCCVCCEVLYLALFLLHLPEYQTLGLLDVQLPPALVRTLQAGPLHPLVDGWVGLPLVGLVALLALPGVAVKQACNWVQLRAAVQALVEHDVKRMA